MCVSVQSKDAQGRDTNEREQYTVRTCANVCVSGNSVSLDFKIKSESPIVNTMAWSLSHRAEQIFVHGYFKVQVAHIQYNAAPYKKHVFTPSQRDEMVLSTIKEKKR